MRANHSASPAWQTAIVVLAGTVVGVVALAGLYWAQAVCVPVALALFLSFVLSPLVTALQRWRLGRPLSVLLPVAGVALVIGTAAWIIGAQAQTMATEMPKYAENIRERIKSLRALGEWPLSRRLETMAREISVALESPPATENTGGAPKAVQPPRVLVQPAMPSWLAFLPGLLARLAESLGGLLLALVLLVFMLLNREDLRNRLLRLFGHHRLTTTTKAIDDASRRISRYLLMQLVVNGVFGMVLSAGLLLIGLPYAFLWGASAFVLRYVPYVGVWVAALPPLLLSLAVFEGWLRPLAVLLLFLALELVAGNVIEPRLYGRSIGVSEIALLVAAAFGAFMWGPIGIVLSSPLVVCLVVVGKYVPFLAFLDVILGDSPALTPDVAYYQRLLAGRREEAREIAAARVKESSREQVCDEILVPALTYFKRDRERGEIPDAKARFVVEAVAELLAAEQFQGPAADSEAANEAPPVRIHLLACPAHDEADRLALDMLRLLLAPASWEVELLPTGTLASELLARVAKQRPGLVCIGAVAPGGLARVRYLSTRLKSRFPEIKLVVGRWGLKHGLPAARQRLREAGVHFVAATLSETRRQLRSLLPALVWQKNKDRASPTGRPEELQQAVKN